MDDQPVFEEANVLRLQLERMQGGFLPSLREYNRVFGVTSERLSKAPKDLLILHPGARAARPSRTRCTSACGSFPGRCGCPATAAGGTAAGAA